MLGPLSQSFGFIFESSGESFNTDSKDVSFLALSLLVSDELILLERADGLDEK